VNVTQIISEVQNLTKINITQSDLSRIWNCGRGNVSYLAKANSDITIDRIKMVEDFYKIKLSGGIVQDSSNQECVSVIYRPNVYLSAGYGIEVYDEEAETILLDKKLFVTDRGIRINPANCEVVTVSGNSMSPEYKHGDRVIIDHSVTTFSDGHIFAFRYNGECFMKEVCVIGKRIKCIPLNKEYEPFFIEPEEEVTIFGRILPRIRL
jgi:phage repressor protein C with HTH and peptisase S24 domain